MTNCELNQMNSLGLKYSTNSVNFEKTYMQCKTQYLFYLNRENEIHINSY